MPIEIKLSQGKVAIVDDEDFEYLNQWKWCAVKNHGHWYAMRTDVSTSTRFTVFMHRVIMKTPTDLVVDHVDQDGLNNKKDNLRNCTSQQNSLNNSSRYGSSAYKGVYYNKDRQKWHARIITNKKRVHLGFFTTEEEAALAYNNAVIESGNIFIPINTIKGGQNVSEC